MYIIKGILSGILCSAIGIAVMFVIWFGIEWFHKLMSFIMGGK